MDDYAALQRELAIMIRRRDAGARDAAAASDQITRIWIKLWDQFPDLMQEISTNAKRVRATIAAPANALISQSEYARRRGVGSKTVHIAVRKGWLTAPAIANARGKLDEALADRQLATLNIHPPTILMRAAQKALEQLIPPLDEPDEPDDSGAEPLRIDVKLTQPEPEPQPPEPPESEPAPQPEPPVPEKPTPAELPPGEWDAPMDQPPGETDEAPVRRVPKLSHGVGAGRIATPDGRPILPPLDLGRAPVVNHEEVFNSNSVTAKQAFEFLKRRGYDVVPHPGNQYKIGPGEVMSEIKMIDFATPIMERVDRERVRVANERNRNQTSSRGIGF